MKVDQALGLAATAGKADMAGAKNNDQTANQLTADQSVIPMDGDTEEVNSRELLHIMAGLIDNKMDKVMSKLKEMNTDIKSVFHKADGRFTGQSGKDKSNQN